MLLQFLCFPVRLVYPLCIAPVTHASFKRALKKGDRPHPQQPWLLLSPSGIAHSTVHKETDFAQGFSGVRTGAPARTLTRDGRALACCSPRGSRHGREADPTWLHDPVSGCPAQGRPAGDLQQDPPRAGQEDQLQQHDGEGIPRAARGAPQRFQELAACERAEGYGYRRVRPGVERGHGEAQRYKPYHST